MKTKTKTLTLGLSAALVAGGAGLCTLPQEAQALSKPPVVQQKAKTVVFKDEVLKNYVLQSMKGQKLIPETATEVSLPAAKKLTKLEVVGIYQPIGKVKDISDLVNFPNLTKIDMSRNQISDLTPLTKLVKLQSCIVDNNNIKDLTPLKSLPELTLLEVSNNPIGKNIEAILEMKKLKTVFATNIGLSNCDFLTKIKDQNYYINLSHNNISTLPKFEEGAKFKSLILEKNAILDLSPLKNVSADGISAGYQHAIINAESNDAFDISKLPKGTKVFKLTIDKSDIDDKLFFKDKKDGIIDGNNLKPAKNETSAVFSFSRDDLGKVDVKGCQLLINYLQKKPATPPVVDNSQSGETYDDGANAPRTPEPFITAGNLIKEIRQTLEQNKDKYTNEQLAALNTKLADYEKQLKAITDSKENIATRVTKARKLVTELQEMRANPLSVIKGKVEKQNTDKAKDEKADKIDKKPIEKIEKTDNLHDKRVFDKDKDKGEKQKGKLPKTSDTAPLGVVGVLAGMLGILAVKPKREKL